MKRNNLVFATVLISCAFFASGFNFPWQKKTSKTLFGKNKLLKVAVIGLPESLSDRVIEHLTLSKRVVPVERKALKNALFEQRFGKPSRKTYLDRTLDKAIKDMDKVEGTTVKAIGTLAQVNDFLKEMKNLGTAVGADYIILGNLEKLSESKQISSVPYSKEGRKITRLVSDARLRLRIIEVKTSTVVGATSFRVKVSEDLFKGKVTDRDEFSFLDEIGRIAATKVLDVIFPARIVKLNPLVLSRGSNDGVKKGDTYIIQREGEKVKDETGIVIARLRKDIGKVEVAKVQETISIANPIEGKDFKVRDLAVFSTATGGAHKIISEVPAVPLHRKAYKSNLPRVAVGLVRSGSTAAKERKNLSVFTDTIISRLVQTKRFRVIDRQEVDQLLTEQLAQAIEEGQGLKSAMGTLKGADYLLYGSVSVFEISKEAVRLPHSTRTFEKKVGRVEGNIRIVDVKNGEIKESRKIVVKRNLKASASKHSLVTHLADAFAEETVSILMDAIYPIKIVAIGQDGTLYINRGEDGVLKKGEALKAYRPGKEIIDPDTGARLGREEIYVGKVVVNEVEDARSKGAQVSGKPLQLGDILKRESKGIAALAPQRSGAKLPISGIVTEEKRKEKATLAVGTFKIARGARTNALSKENLPALTNDLIVKLTNTNRFKVMERQEVDQLLDEKAFLGAATESDIRNSLRQLRGSDYMIYGEISRFSVDVSRVKVPYLDELQTIARGVAEGTLRIVDVATGEIVAGDKIHTELQRKGEALNISDIRSELIDLFTSRAVSGIESRIFPIRVIGVTADGTVYLNRGKDGDLSSGMVFNLMRPGEKMKDPDTGLYFGTAETKIGLVRVVSVEPFRSRCELISGQSPKVGDIVRSSVEKAATKPKPKTIKVNW